MARAPQHVFQVLTKSPERMLDFLSTVKSLQVAIATPQLWEPHPLPLSNVWLGVSVENQATADERIPLLLETPAAVRWLSCEPLLAPINLDAPSAYETDRRGWLAGIEKAGERAAPRRIDGGHGGAEIGEQAAGDCGGEAWADLQDLDSFEHGSPLPGRG